MRSNIKAETGLFFSTLNVEVLTRVEEPPRNSKICITFITHNMLCNFLIPLRMCKWNFAEDDRRQKDGGSSSAAAAAAAAAAEALGELHAVAMLPCRVGNRLLLE